MKYFINIFSKYAAVKILQSMNFIMQFSNIAATFCPDKQDKSMIKLTHMEQQIYYHLVDKKIR
jgi:hypothetical protein